MLLPVNFSPKIEHQIKENVYLCAKSRQENVRKALKSR